MSQMDIVEILDDTVVTKETELTEFVEVVDDWISVRTATVNPQFSMAGALVTKVGNGKYPIPAGTWRITSILATLVSASAGASVIADVNIDGVTVFTGGKIVFPAGSTTPTVGSWVSATYTLGNMLTIDVDQVGSPGTTGDTLVISILLERTA